MTDQHLTIQAACALPEAVMAASEVTTRSIANGGDACAGPAYQLSSADIGNKRASISSITSGFWELAVKAAIRIASSRNRATADSPGGGAAAAAAAAAVNPFPQQKALPPLPAVPPVGPGGRRLTRHHSLPLTHCQHPTSKSPPSSPAPSRRVLTRSQSMADILSAMVAARLRPAGTFARSTHCQECNQRFSLIFRRHHCRTCQRSVCAYCSTYQRVPCDLEEETETETKQPIDRAVDEDEGGGGDNRGDGVDSRTSPTKETTVLQGVLHRVCRKCAAELEGKQSVYSRSWTEEFSSLRRFFKQGRQVVGVLDNTHLLPPKIPKLPPVCEAIARSFLEECKKNVKNKSRFLTTSASFNAGLQYALKPPGQKLCSTCSKLLRFPVERKTCVLCDEVFCRNCSTRDLALSMPDDLDPGDIRHEIAQVNVRVLTTEEAEELDKHSNNTATGSSGTAMQRYRVCQECRDHVSHVLKVMTFNDILTHTQAELVELQEQIAAVLDEQDTPSPGIGLTRWPSVRSVHTYKSVEDEIVGEAVNERVAQKLLERFFQVYLELERLKPETVTQGVLFKHVKQAMTAFYVTRKSVSSKRFRRRESLTGMPSSPSPLWY